MKASLNSLHHQETDWLRELAFYNQETDLLTQRLNEVMPFLDGAHKTGLQEFAGRFAAIKTHCAVLTKENTERYERLNQMAKVIPGQIEDEFTADKDVMNKQMDDFATLFRNTRFHFNTYLAKIK